MSSAETVVRCLLLTLAVGFSACGDDGDGRATPPSVEPTVTTVAATPTIPTTTRPPERLTADSRLRLDGIGPVQIGMTLSEASSAAGVQIRPNPSSPFGPRCEYASAEGIDELAFMVINGRIARIDVPRGARITTVSGIAVGATEADVQRTYPGRITVEPHTYVRNGHYLVYTAADPTLQHLSLLFETDGRVVTTFRSGLRGAVAAPEGCA